MDSGDIAFLRLAYRQGLQKYNKVCVPLAYQTSDVDSLSQHILLMRVHLYVSGRCPLRNYPNIETFDILESYEALVVPKGR
jgi:hypothetical protein